MSDSINIPRLDSSRGQYLYIVNDKLEVGEKEETSLSISKDAIQYILKNLEHINTNENYKIFLYELEKLSRKTPSEIGSDVIVKVENKFKETFSQKDQEKLDFIKSMLTKGSYLIKDASLEMKSDREVLLVAVELFGNALKYAQNNLNNDLEIVLKAVSSTGKALEFASREMQNNKQVVLKAVAGDWSSLEFASEDLKNDMDVVGMAVSIDGSGALEFAGKELKNDKNLVLTAITHNWRSLKYASEGLKKDKEVILKALLNNVKAFEYADDELKHDSAFLLEFIKKYPKKLDDILQDDRRGQFQLINELFKLFPDRMKNYYVKQRYKNREDKTLDKAKFHFLLDKIPVETQTFWASFIDISGMYLIRAVNEVVDDIKKERDDRELSEADQTLIQILSSLASSIAITVELNSIQNDNVRQKLISKLLDTSPIDFPILLPTGSLGHSMVCCIKRKPHDKFQLTLYNTGDGVEKYHHKSQNPDVNKYQTHLIIDDLDADVLKDPNIWDKFMEARWSEDVEAIYSWFKELSTKGKERAPSENPNDYEQKQISGTCSAQCLMAFIRHQIMEASSGDLKKMGMYKLLKARTIFKLGSEDLEATDKLLKEHLSKKLELVGAEIALSKIAESGKEFESIFDSIAKNNKALQKPTGVFERFAFLREYALKMDDLKTGSIEENALLNYARLHKLHSKLKLNE